nr:membrane protein [Gordonia sp. NB41Y]
MVIFFEVLLALASVLIIWFALYVLYRLVTDES